MSKQRTPEEVYDEIRHARIAHADTRITTATSTERAELYALYRRQVAGLWRELYDALSYKQPDYVWWAVLDSCDYAEKVADRAEENLQLFREVTTAGGAS